MILITDYAVDENANVYVSDLLMDSASSEMFVEQDPRTFASDLLVVFKDEYGLEMDALALQSIPASLISKIARNEPIHIEDLSTNRTVNLVAEFQGEPEKAIA